MLVSGYALEHDVVVGRSYEWDFSNRTNQINPDNTSHQGWDCPHCSSS